MKIKDSVIYHWNDFLRSVEVDDIDYVFNLN